MIRITKIQKALEKRYSVATVSHAIGRSEGSISAYFSNRGISTKRGITLEMIAEVALSPTRGQIIQWEDINEIRDGLREKHGLIVTEDTRDE